jgi:hypothetical protein
MTKGDNIYRSKGILAIEHAAEKFVYQGVHTVLYLDFVDEEWSEGEERVNKLVFIGKNLDREELMAGFAACLATPALLEKKREALRFAVEDHVECKVGGRWRKGEVVAQIYREEGMAPGLVAPYQVKLKDGDLIYAPADDDDVVRRVGAGKTTKKPAGKTATQKATKKTMTKKTITKKAAKK